MKKIILIFWTLFYICSLLSAELYYDQWEQITELTAGEQKNKITVILRAELPKRQYYNSWSYAFSYADKVRINRVLLNGRQAKYEFINNELRVDIGQLFDKQHCTLSFEYLEKSQPENFFYNQQYVSIPHWLSKIPLNLRVILADEFIACSRHRNFRQSKNIFSFNGKIPVNGLQELFIWTPRQSVWQVERTYTIHSNNNKKDFNFYFPKIGHTGDSTVLSYAVKSSQTPKKIDDRKAFHSYVLNDNGTIELKINIVLRKRPGEENYQPPNEEFLTVDSETASYLKDLARKILDGKSELPPHVKLAEWVHGYLTYDRGLISKEQTILQILERKRGVCQDYAKLYLQLCRAAKIPALEVSGLSYSNIDPAGRASWESHSWVIVKVGNKWLPVDPTWNLTFGILPSSHVALYYPEEINYSYRAENHYGRLIVKEKTDIKELK